MEKHHAMTYLASPEGSTVLARLEDPALSMEWKGSETTVRPVDPVERFFLAKSSEERWQISASVPKNESAVQQIINYVIFNGRPSDEDDTISLLASIGWPTLGVALRFQRLNTRAIRPIYVGLVWDLLAQSLVTAEIDIAIKRSFLEILASSTNRAISYVARDALESVNTD
jgi:hypothetical protein